ncbi:MAG: carboxypeptidase regulatory-like domain-containing protein [Planctomycetes bacterium]|nr:carboxypeptidase regulatory-like domain-containing protein [Planctomycetota bacterium]
MPTSDPSARRPALRGAVLLVIACGCSGPNITFAPVEGTVTRNGKPLPRAQVIFYADEESGGPRATGLTDEAGKFRLATDDGKEGAPVGRHRVCVLDTNAAAERLGLLAKHGPPDGAGKGVQPKAAGKSAPVPPEYGRPAETPLRAEVRPGPQTLNFQIP